MSHSIQSDVPMGRDFSGASQPDDLYGDIGYEAAFVGTHAHYLTVGRGAECDLPPGATATPHKISAPSIPRGFDCDS